MTQGRFLPLVAFAALSLLLLKAADLLLGGGTMLTGAKPAGAEVAAQAGGNPPGKSQKNGAKDSKATAAAKPAKGDRPGAEDRQPADGRLSDQGEAGAEGRTGPFLSPPKGEVAVLQRLAARRKVLEQRERQLQLKEAMLQAVEKRITQRIAELKRLEARISQLVAQEKQAKSAKIGRLVKLYGAMKPKQAARILERLEERVLLALAKQMPARKLAAIMAAMAPDQAQRLTLALAGGKDRPSSAENRGPATQQLPKIEGVPTSG